jgi:hypothetical protein
LKEFELHINNSRYKIIPPRLETLSSEELKKISDVKYLISELYEALNIQEFQLQKEAEIQKVSFFAVFRIRILIHFGWLDPDLRWEYGSGSRRAKMTHKNEDNSSFEVLDVEGRRLLL